MSIGLIIALVFLIASWVVAAIVEPPAFRNPSLLALWAIASALILGPALSGVVVFH